MTSEEQGGTSPAKGRKTQVGGVAAAPPDNPEELKQEIERTREQLGETVEALAAKADVKAQARAKASQVTGRLRSRTAQARQRAAATTGRLRRQLAGKSAGPRQKAASMRGPAADRARQQAAVAAERLSKVKLDPVQRVAARAAATGRERRVQLVMAAGAVVLAWLLIARWRQR
jgi:Protein of unknown function (DUF3618)